MRGGGQTDRPGTDHHDRQFDPMIAYPGMGGPSTDVAGGKNPHRVGGVGFRAAAPRAGFDRFGFRCRRTACAGLCGGFGGAATRVLRWRRDAADVTARLTIS
jgi:hypothetical protein